MPHESIICPICGGENDHDAVFCANSECHKALGEFKYVAEELKEKARWHETLADRVTEFIGRPHFLVVHLTWFTLWVLANTGIFAFIRTFDMYPFGLLGIILSAEAIFITGFILISQNRQNVHSEKLAEIDYEISVRTYRRVLEIAERLASIDERVKQLESSQIPPSNE